MKFSEIKYDKENNMFKFSFDYNDFNTKKLTLAKTQWTVYSNGTRIKKIYENGKFTGKSEEINVTEWLIGILNELKINFKDEHNIIYDINALNENDKAISELVYAFRLIVQLRNSLSESEEEKNGVEYDRLISPVMNENGIFFDSFDYKSLNDKNIVLPCDADANGAYCIALKGLYVVNQIKEHLDKNEFNEKNLFVSNEAWFDYIQNRRYL